MVSPPELKAEFDKDYLSAVDRLEAFTSQKLRDGRYSGGGQPLNVLLENPVWIGTYYAFEERCRRAGWHLDPWVRTADYVEQFLISDCLIRTTANI